jgi:hypothetical protein
MELIPVSRQIDRPVDLPDIESILAGQLAASSIAMYKRDVQAYVDYTSGHSLHWLEPQSLVAWRDELAIN